MFDFDSTLKKTANFISISTGHVLRRYIPAKNAALANNRVFHRYLLKIIHFRRMTEKYA
ncbi:hypothetical protein [Colwellia sp. TT2012]|uniref:hypothetical protein n=1 Tax=Colwellia sp. TT2012 TaxID=1720342 RepID=UPI000A8E571E|nr:hypothetical protein [Colwellia sp. TT2012]